MDVVADFKTDRGVRVICRRPSADEITDEERQRRQDKFALTAYQIMLKCKERLIAEGREDELKKCGLEDI